MVEKSAGGGAKSYPAGQIVPVNPCDFCKPAPALPFCPSMDTASVCMSCDDKLHGHTKHKRVSMCEVCKQVPACVTCKADAAALCVTCDRDIHSANPLARRHVRIPVVPFYDSTEAVVNSTAGNMVDPVFGYGNTVLNSSVAKEEDDSREISRNVTNIDVKIPSDTSPAVMKSADLLSAGDRLFKFGFEGLESQLHDSGNDGLVPLQSMVPIADHKSTVNGCFNNCNKSNSQSHSRSVSSSSMDAGVVLEENSLLDVSNPFMLPVNGGGMYCNKKAKQFCATDREARVLRYREKRKKRKFEKKIRYASRKAYAEMRPRIKGRFVKRTELMTALDVDRWWFTAESDANSYGAGVEYGVVPSF